MSPIFTKPRQMPVYDYPANDIDPGMTGRKSTAGIFPRVAPRVTEISSSRTGGALPPRAPQSVRPGTDVATTNWQNQVDKARAGGIMKGGSIRLNGAGGGLFSGDRARMSAPLSREQRIMEHEMNLQREQNRGVLGSARINADASNYGNDSQLRGVGIQAGVTARGQDTTLKGIGLGEQGATRRQSMQDETTRRGQDTTLKGIGLGEQGATRRQGMQDETTIRGQDLTAQTELAKVGAEQARAAVRPRLEMVDGRLGMIDGEGKFSPLSDAEQRRGMMVMNLTKSYDKAFQPAQVSQFLNNANERDPGRRLAPVYDNKTGQAKFISEQQLSGSSRFKKEEVIKGRDGKEVSRYTPLQDLDETAYAMFLDYADQIASRATR